MRLQKSSAAYSILEFLCNMGGAARKDIYTAMGPCDSGSVTGGLRKLEEMSFTRTGRMGRTEFILPTVAGREYLESSDGYYLENRDLFRPQRVSRINENTGTREAAALCMNASRRIMKMGLDHGRTAVYRKDKPSPGDVLRFMREMKTAEPVSKNGYMPCPDAEGMEQLLRGGIFYTSAEMKRFFAEEDVPFGSGNRKVNRGSESMVGSRITAFLFNLCGMYVFYRSDGSIPRFRFEVESRMIRAVLDAGASRFANYAAGAGSVEKVRPTAVMISRSAAMIPALITGYSHGRIRREEAERDSAAAKRNRKFYERQLFNPCCGLYRGVYAVPYHSNRSFDLCYILNNDPQSIREEGERWCRRFLGIRLPLPLNGVSGDFACAHDDSCGCDIIYSPVIDIALYRSTLREFIHSHDRFYPCFAVVTQRHYAEPLARAVSRKISRMYDAVKGCRLDFKRYDIFGYPEEGPDPYAAASRAWWDSDRCPRKTASLSLRLPPEALEELKKASEKTMCSVSRMAGHIVAGCLDGGEWKARFGTGKNRKMPYTEMMLEQDRRTGVNLKAAPVLEDFLRKKGGGDD